MHSTAVTESLLSARHAREWLLYHNSCFVLFRTVPCFYSYIRLKLIELFVGGVLNSG